MTSRPAEVLSLPSDLCTMYKARRHSDQSLCTWDKVQVVVTAVGSQRALGVCEPKAFVARLELAVVGCSCSRSAVRPSLLHKVDSQPALAV